MLVYEKPQAQNFSGMHSPLLEREKFSILICLAAVGHRLELALII